MTDLKNDTHPAQESLWEYVPTDKYILPPTPMSYRVKGGIAGVLQKLRPTEKKPESPLGEDDVLETLSDRLKRFIAQKPDWHPAALALEKTLTNWGDGSKQQRIVIVVVAPPHVPNGAILKHFADIRDWRVIAPPTAEQILAADDNWLSDLTDRPSPWILPNLEKCYLRHHRGLALVRRLFALLQNGQAAQGVIGSDSWTWAYFQRVMPELLPLSFTLQAFDPLRLARWFRDLAPGYQGEPVRFRQSNNGNDVLPPPSKTKESAESTTTTSLFIQDLAAYSRGIPGIAWPIWGGALRSLPEAADDSKKASVAALDYHNTIWLPPWEQLNLPTLPTSVGTEQLLVLHSLLLHAGLIIEHLPEVLPLTAVECNQALSALKNANLIEQELYEWRVSAVAYPAVRQLLEDQGYLTDNF